MRKEIKFVFFWAIILVLPFVAAAARRICNSEGFFQIGLNLDKDKELISLPCGFHGEPGPAGALTFGYGVTVTIQVALLLVGSLAVLFLIWGGLRYITAHGNEEQAESAKRVITNAIVGIIVVILSFVMVTVITNILVLGAP